MKDNAEYMIWIYHNAVQIEAPTRGKERYLKEKAFLNQLTRQHYAPGLLPRATPDPSGDFYILDDEQLNAYSAFRRELGKQ